MSSVIWLVDRSRYETGLSRCARERFLEYHFGPSGYGIRMKSGSMPQMRGIYIHEASAILFAHLQAEGELPSDAVVRAAAKAACDKYNRVVDARGIRLLADEQSVERIAKEQQALITGMTWVLALEVLPWFHAEYKVVSVEEEEVGVLGCTCGLGDLIGTVEDHEARDCSGIGWMSRADCIAEHRGTGRWAYFEIKTGGYASRAEDWETKIQFSAAVLGAEAKHGRVVDESWVLNLIVGKREGSYDYETRSKSGPPMQQSVCCYGYRKLPEAPGMVEEWDAEYNYIDEAGRSRRLGKGWTKAPVWEMDPRVVPAGVDPAEYWIRWVGAGVRNPLVNVIGPLTRQAVLLDGFQQELVAEERRWQSRLWELYDSGAAWASADYQALLNELVPRAWSCRRFGQRYECQFTTLCFQREGWQEPLAGGTYQLRRPHHTPETLQAEARGIALPEDEGESDD